MHDDCFTDIVEVIHKLNLEFVHPYPSPSTIRTVSDWNVDTLVVKDNTCIAGHTERCVKLVGRILFDLYQFNPKGDCISQSEDQP